MSSTTVDAVIPAPRERVYRLFTQRDSLNAYLPINFTLQRPGSPEPTGVGARYRVGRGGFGITEETTALVPGERMEYKIIAGAPVKSHTGTITFADAPDGGTLVSYRMESFPKLPVPDRLTQLFLRGLITPFLSAARKAAAE
ncbi:SRPBCC family protein [Nocardia terpenica]|uniref:SRPBCC family protein n=1 Tax=Nocardia terpenica TaxID=455432 RepID=UPI001895C90B|nr:SRPBCC family protein [Nocardia terpenica]MBF6065759.1 SRPBCC family protein [Nocardia terpenica]MBF6108203.1 SRPBCC family protein [Nocardia terpenica]MBF6115874.1 SRPBCC family protein [Nocardia terpenica]MBF6123004.1 SRPBCC family protein [Nocardia terpenica]MBF6155923.1 SRPBCC family protein [Nocardia terpenica]